MVSAEMLGFISFSPTYAGLKDGITRREVRAKFLRVFLKRSPSAIPQSLNVLLRCQGMGALAAISQRIQAIFIPVAQIWCAITLCN